MRKNPPAGDGEDVDEQPIQVDPYTVDDHDPFGHGNSMDDA